MFIYGIEFKGKILYVGQTITSPEVRWWKHQSNARTGKMHCPKLYNHMRKYDAYNYKLVVLEECEKEKLEEREKYWIEKYSTFGQEGLNCHPGGNQVSGEHHYLYGKKPARYIVDASIAVRIGKKHTQEHIEKIRAGNLGKKQPQNYIPISCDQNGKTYESFDAAAKDLGIGLHNISFFMRGEASHAKGFTFKYVDPFKESQRTTKEPLKPWANSGDASSSKASESRKAYFERLKQDPEKYKQANAQCIVNAQKANAARAKKIRRSDGVIYDSIADAGRILSPDNPERGRGGIKRCLQKGYQYKGYTFEQME